MAEFRHRRKSHLLWLFLLSCLAGAQSPRPAHSSETLFLTFDVAGAKGLRGWRVSVDLQASGTYYVADSFQPSEIVPDLQPQVTETSLGVSVGGSAQAGSANVSQGTLGTIQLSSTLPTESVTVIVTNYMLDLGTLGELTETSDITVSFGRKSPIGAFNEDGYVDWPDFFLFADNFGGSDPLFDIVQNGLIDFEDLFLFADKFDTHGDVTGRITLRVPESATAEVVVIGSTSTTGTETVEVKGTISSEETVNVEIIGTIAD